ncbi:MAG: prepilin peptidase [Alphaproteobacteria bacterium]|nr:prepilin peptidase [Alphaproteobacteria bacterium]MCW5744178.1 prepilin peptidase [Alphaproteobacteria bacterium]
MSEALQLVDLILISGFAALAIGAALSDWARFVIPNQIPVAIAGLFAVHAGVILLGGGAAMSLVWALACGAAVFAGGAFLFSQKVLGGGDVKLMAVCAMWAGPSHIVEFVLVTTLYGALLSAAFLLPAFRQKSELADTGFSGSVTAALRRRLPYGLAIATGAVVVCLRLLTEARA